MNTATATKTVALTANITAASGGFGMFQAGTTEFAWSDPSDRGGDGAQELDAFLETSRDNGFDLETTDEIDGRIQFASAAQTAAQVYKWEDGGETRYCLLWIADAE